MGGIVIGFIGIIAIWRLGSSEGAWDEALKVLSTAVIILAVPFVYGWHFVSVPPRKHADQQRELDDANERLAAAEAAQEPSIKFDPTERDRALFVADRKRPGGSEYSLGLLPVRNHSTSKTATNLGALETRLDARLSQLATQEHIRGSIREARYWAIGTIIAVISLMWLYLSYGRDQFEAGIQLTTGTINYGIEAKKAQEKAEEAHKESAKKFDQVLELLKQRRQEDPPSQSKKPQ